jgi:hypothetical protein
MIYFILNIYILSHNDIMNTSPFSEALTVENFKSYILCYYIDLLGDFSYIDLSFLKGCYK